ncbi:MAG: hypothetical protein ACYC0T_13840 [Ramlibacter sp.]
MLLVIPPILRQRARIQWGGGSGMLVGAVDALSQNPTAGRRSRENCAEAAEKNKFSLWNSFAASAYPLRLLRPAVGFDPAR